MQAIVVYQKANPDTSIGSYCKSCKPRGSKRTILATESDAHICSGCGKSFTRREVTTVIQLPQTTVGAYDVTVFPACFSGGPVYAMVYPTGSRKAVWETLQYGTPQEAIEDAKVWITATAQEKGV